MREFFGAMARHAQIDGCQIAVSDANGPVSRIELLRRVSGLAETIRPLPRVVGLLAPNDVEWVVGQLACALAGKIVVPLPNFFSPGQLEHIGRDAGVELVLATEATRPDAARMGVATHLIGDRQAPAALASVADGFGQIIYTSGSTGQPKGVRHESGQLAWSTQALAAASDAREDDRFLSVLPLCLLLETICAVFLPLFVGGRSHFGTGVAERAAAGRPAGIAAAFETHRPTASVMVPQLLKIWVAELAAARQRAPRELRFVATGGAPVPPSLADEAWHLGIPVHEGYGLSECCSVVSLNRPGRRSPGTSGPPLPGLEVTIDGGEIVVAGPSITDGYLGRAAAPHPWRTGDLGMIDVNGCLVVHGRKDDLIVTSFGRNVSPEWIETMILDDPRIALCGVFGHGDPFPTAVLVPSSAGAAWFAQADDVAVEQLIDERCRDAPRYAVPRAALVCSFEVARNARLLTGNGRFIRKLLPEFAQSRLPQAAPSAP